MAAVKGINQVLKQLRKQGKDIERIIDAETQAIAFQIEKDAKTRAPKNFGKLAQSISTLKVEQSIYKITVNELYGGYMEFGTGTKVRVPAEFKDISASLKGQKQGTYKEGLESIRVWCRAKGIDEKFAYVIFAKILGAGIEPRPFLYPAWVKGKKDYLDNLNKLLKKYS